MDDNKKFDFREREIHIYFLHETQEMELSFFLNKQNHKMVRDIGESMTKTCQRMAKKFSKEKRIEITVSRHNQVVDTSLLINAQWQSGMQVFIKGFGTLNTIVNCPVVRSFSCFPIRHIRVGSPVVPTVETKFATSVLFSWFCKGPSDLDYKWVCDGDVFWPGQDTLDSVVKVFATPYSVVPHEEDSKKESHRQFGRSVTLYLNRPVEAEAPTPRSLEVRLDFFGDSAGEVKRFVPSACSLRLMTYNILANAYATSPHAMYEMYSYVPSPEIHLSEEYRGALVVKELLACKAHLIALQECDKSLFDKYLFPIMRQAGYWGHFTNKEGCTVEGCAIFAHRPSLRMLRCYDVSYREVFRAEPRLQALFDLRPDIRDYMVNKIGSIGQILVVACEACPERVVVVGNTHLFYHPQGCHVRLLQMDALMGAMLRIREQLLLTEDCVNTDEESPSLRGIKCCDSNGEHVKAHGQDEVGPIALILMGDMNSAPDSVVVDLLRSGAVEATHEAWFSINRFSWHGSEHDGIFNGDLTIQQKAEFNDSILPILPPISHPLNMMSASGFPPFSNYTRDFKMTLDYIFVDADSFSVAAVAPTPSEDVLKENVALPSVVFPSDHISLIVDIDFIPEKCASALSFTGDYTPLALAIAPSVSNTQSCN